MPNHMISIRQCAWCGRQVTDESKPTGQAQPLDAVKQTTHGICVACLDRWLSEYEERRLVKATA